MKIFVHIKILKLCIGVPVMSISSYKIVHHFSMFRIIVMIKSLVYNP
jgi:hypothetical protein